MSCFPCVTDIRTLLMLSSIPALESRLKAWLYKLDFDEITKDIETPLSALAAATQEVKSSDALRKILGITLAFGNYLNAGESFDYFVTLQRNSKRSS